MSLDDEGNIVLHKKSQHKAQLLIQELMILCNRAVAQYAAEKEIPILYRNHRAGPLGESRQKEMLDQLSAAFLQNDFTTMEHIQKEFGERVGRARYSPDREEHWGLKLTDGYCHFTSPIRRYADLVTQRQIAAYLLNGRAPYKRLDLSRLGAELSKRSDELKDEEKRKKEERRKIRAVTFAEGVISKMSSGETLRPLARPEITTVLKADCARPEIDSLFSSAILGLIDNKEINSDEIFIILARTPKDSESWGALRRATLEYLFENLSLAVSVLDHSEKKYPDAFSGITFTDSARGRGFSCTLHARIFGEPIEVEGPACVSKKEAKSSACAFFWNRLCGNPIEPESFYAKPPVVHSTNKPKSPPKEGKNSICALNEFCQDRGLNTPVTEFKTSGPPHQPEFSCQMALRIPGQEKPIVSIASGADKQNTKAEAARGLLEKLSEKSYSLSTNEKNSNAPADNLDAVNGPMTRAQIISALNTCSEHLEINPNVSTAVLDLLAKKDIKPDELFVILAKTSKTSEDWKNIRHAALTFLSENDTVAIGVLDHAKHKYPAEWSGITFNENIQGTVFSCTINAHFPQASESMQVEGPIRGKKSEAKAAAAVAFLSNYCGEELDLAIDSKISAPDSSAKDINAPIEVKTENSSPISVLNEYCQVKKITLPVADFEESGSSHEKEFTCSLKLTLPGQEEPLVSSGPSTNKQSAKKKAAKRMLKQMNEKGLVVLVPGTRCG